MMYLVRVFTFKLLQRVHGDDATTFMMFFFKLTKGFVQMPTSNHVKCRQGRKLTSMAFTVTDARSLEVAFLIDTRQ
jgi:hypothetical protein